MARNSYSFDDNRFSHDPDDDFSEPRSRGEASESTRARRAAAMAAEELESFDREGRLDFNGTRQEKVYVTESLGGFFDDRWFDQILFKVKGGKEANVYCCRATPEVAAAVGAPLLAAKVYRPRMFRAMHNDWFYKQGRTALDGEGKAAYRGRSLRASNRDTRIGQKVDMVGWCRWEYETLEALHAAGAVVPRPLAVGETAILMQYLGDPTAAAPTLHGLEPDRPTARRWLASILADIERALAHRRIHSDLSAHNILVHDDRPWLIDWPQAVDATRHPEAREMLMRDLERVIDYFARLGVHPAGLPAGAGNARRIAGDLWHLFERANL